MSYGPKSSQEYLKSAVMTASPEQLQLMLIDGAIRFATRGREAIERGDREASFNAFDRAQKIVAELADGLRPEVNPQLVEQIAGLYNFIYRRLIQANTELDARAAEDALKILRDHRETWQLLVARIRQAQPKPAAAAPPPVAQTGSLSSSFVAEG